MAIKTEIEWCDSTLNLQMGCDGCELWNPKAGVKRCYAGRLTERWGGKKGWPVTFEQPAVFPERLQEALRWPDLTGTDRPDKPWLNGYPRVIFLNDMGDTFTASLPLMWLTEFLPGMIDSPHVYIILTKRPARMVEFWRRYTWIPNNFWLLTSVTGPENIGRIENIWRIRELLRLRALGARVLGVSYEPAWGPVDFRPWLPVAGSPLAQGGVEWPYLSWLIAGGESGAGAKPSHPDWFRAARDACQTAGTAFFMKQITDRGRKLPFGQWPGDLQVREMPRAQR